MDKTDIASLLISQGVSEQDARRVKGTIKGSDLMNLVSALNNKSALQGQQEATKILGKYGIKLGSGQDMKKRDDYLNAKFESFRTGRALDETMGVMTRVDEGFNYSVEVNETNRDKVLDWLDENAVEYQATGPMNYQIECGDRDVAYRTGRALSEIIRKPTVRDSVEIEEKMSKNPNKRVNDAKAKMAKITPKDPNRQAAAMRSGAGYHKGEADPRKVDKGGRGAKYKPRYDEEIEEPINEGVMGMKSVNPLFRLRELAGLPMQANNYHDIKVAEAPDVDPLGHLSAGPVGGDPMDDMDMDVDMDGIDMDVDGMGDDPVADPMPDMDGGMDAGMDAGIDEPLDTIDMPDDDAMPDTDIDVLDPDAGVPGALGSDPIEDPMNPGPDLGMGGGAAMGGPAMPPVGGMNPMGMGMATTPTQSEAMSAIEDSLNSIQTGLADIRLSEYKSLVQKLQDLTNQAQMMGRDYLGEARRKK
jgi:hypothetical protein